LAGIAMVLDRHARRASGGGIRMFLGITLETLLAGLLAPVTMLSQAVSVASILAGRDAGWQPQQRDDGTYPFRQVAHRYAGHTWIGILLGVISYIVSPSLFLWMSPVVAGLTLA